jgi:hypothetical protein
LDRAVDSQIAQLRDFARKRGWDVAEFIDTDVSIDAERRPRSTHRARR